MAETDIKEPTPDKAALCIRAISDRIKDLRAGSISIEDALDEIEDLIDIWEGRSDETVDYKFK